MLVMLIVIAAVLAGWIVFGDRVRATYTLQHIEHQRHPLVKRGGLNPQPIEESGPESPIFPLHIWLRALTRPRYTRNVPPVPHLSIWPSASTDPQWDMNWIEDTETVQSLHELGAKHMQYRRGEEVVSAAKREGFLDHRHPTSPEDALVMLYSSWVEMEVEQQHQWEDYLSRHLPPNEQWHTLSGAERARIGEQEHIPLEDPTAVTAVVDAILEKWAEHPVVDHALLAELRASLPLSYGSPVPGTLVEPMDQIEDPLIREQAALTLTKLSRHHDIADEVLDAVLATKTSDPRNDLRLATWTMNRAAATGDWKRARAAADRLRGVLIAECGGSTEFLHCDGRSYELREVTARLIALGMDEAHTWQEALSGVAWRCHLETPQHGVSVNTASWDGQTWVFDAWNHETETARCLASSPIPPPRPPAPLRARITLEGPE